MVFLLKIYRLLPSQISWKQNASGRNSFPLLLVLAFFVYCCCLDMNNNNYKFSVQNFVRIHLKWTWHCCSRFHAKIGGHWAKYIVISNKINPFFFIKQNSSNQDVLCHYIYILDVFFQVLPIVIVVKEKGFIVQHHMELLAVGTDLLMVDQFPIFLVQGLLIPAFLNHSVY